jgi:Domain of unknown function (DUF4281)
MGWETWFAMAGMITAPSWLALIVLPRWDWLRWILRYAVPGVLAVAYTVLAAVYFAQAKGGGYNSLAEVKALLGTDPTLLAGWVHYLAFDLLIGVWIAERADAIGISRWLQAPILIMTFLFGPVGYLMFIGAQAALGLGAATASKISEAAA